MKKILAFTLAAVMVLSLIACGEKKNPSAAGETTLPVETTEVQVSDIEKIQEVLANTQGFRVGYARADITPQASVPLAGFGNTSMRMSDNVQRYLYATCLAITDEDGQTALIYSIDNINTKAFLEVRPLLETATGVPQERILLNATHTHAGPDTAENKSEPHIQDYTPWCNSQIIAAGISAMLDLKPATMYYGSIETENMNFIKHYKYVAENGEVKYFGDNFGTQTLNDTTEHATQIDTTMHLMKFQREGEKDIILSNWRAHPLLESAKDNKSASSDFVGGFREAIELKADCEFIYLQGCAGNNNSHSRISSEIRTRDCAEYGAILADYALEGLKNAKEVEPGKVQSKQLQYTAKYCHSTDHMLTDAMTVSAVWSATNNYNEAVAAAPNSGIRSPYHATSIIRRSKFPETGEVELTVVTVGEHLAFAANPFEMFDTLGEQIEAESPYEFTMTLAYTNGYQGYLPSAIGWEYTSYETDVTYFEPGTGEEIVEQSLNMLKELKGK